MCGMKKFLFTLILTIFAVSLGWRSLSEDMREQALTLITIAKNRDREGAKAFLYDVLVSESPREERRVIIQRLKEQVEKIKGGQKNSVLSGGIQAFDGDIKDQIPLPALIKGAEESINELEKANEKETIGEIVTQKISNAVFPQNAECKREE